jgi:hypothetical protein
MGRQISRAMCVDKTPDEGVSSVYTAGVALLALASFALAGHGFLMGGVFYMLPLWSNTVQLMLWLSALAAPLSELVIGLVLAGLALQYIGGRLRLPSTASANIGRKLTTFAVGSAMLFTVWQVFQSMMYGNPLHVWLFISINPLYFWMSVLMAGVVMVEGSRIREIARVGERPKEEFEWVDTHAGLHPEAANSAPARLDLRLGTCPKCSVKLPMSAMRCLSCGARFGRGGGWRVQGG